MFPNNKRYSTLRSKIESCEVPKPGEGFVQHPAICKRTVYSLEDAEKLTRKALHTSNIEDSHTDSDDGASGISAMSYLPSSPLTSDHHGSVSAKSTSVSSVTRVTPSAVDSSIQDHLRMIMKDIKAMQFEMKGLKTTISTIDTNVRILNEKFENMEGQKRILIPATTVQFDFPIDSYEEFSTIDDTCTNTEDRMRLVKVLYLCGGDTIKEAVQMIMKKVSTKKLCLEFSLRGKLKKKAFGNTKIYQAIIEAVRQRFEHATDSEIDKIISRWLITACDRDGGRKDRQSAKQVTSSPLLFGAAVVSQDTPLLDTASGSDTWLL